MALISIANNASMFKAAITSELNNSFLVQQSIFFLQTRSSRNVTISIKLEVDSVI